MIIRLVTNPTRSLLAIVVLLNGLVFAEWAEWMGAKRCLAAETCPFCPAASQTLRQEIASMDAAAIGRINSDGKNGIEGLATFTILKVLSGDKLIRKDQSIEASYLGPTKTEKSFLLLGIDPTRLLWSSPLALSPEAEKYIEDLRKLPDSQSERLEFFQKFFEHPDPLIARDCFDEFALAPYSDVLALKDKMDREKLLGWVQDRKKSPDRKRLYFTMLAICGKPEDTVLLETMIKSEIPEDRAGLDALLAAYLTLKGEKGLDLIKDSFLDNLHCPFADIYSAVMALRFHGTEANVLSKGSVIGAMHRLLERPELGDLVIPDLARWNDWSQVAKVSELFEKSTDETNWVRVPVINYLRACPLPEAQVMLTKLEKIDPNAFKRAKTFFPIPTPTVPKVGGVE
jgi:hypothetical protein